MRVSRSLRLGGRERSLACSPFVDTADAERAPDKNIRRRDAYADNNS
ncbi:MAG: hypothetical protein OSJ67_05885 [Clostridia bacterium]|nr:hypothetical protein [Clostridia bacterium]